jgi:hypothetical protein
MPDTNWIEFSEEKTGGWKATSANGVTMEVWASIDEPHQFRITIGNVLDPDFYPGKDAAMEAAERAAAAGGLQVS